MKKMLLFVLLLLATFQLWAQEPASCSEGKIKSYHHILKKTRAGNYANSLMAKYDVHFYFLDLNAERTTTVLSGVVTMGVNVLSVPIDTFCFELNPNLIIDSVVYNSQNLTVSRLANITYALLPVAVAPSSNMYVKIYYHGDASVTGAGAIGDGFSTGTSGSWGNKATWSLSQPYSAYEWFPCKQFLQDKADSVWVFVTTDSVNKAGSNGILMGVDTGLAGGKVRYRWQSHYMTDYYLISVAVAKYIDYTIYAHPTSLPNDSVKIVNYIYNNPATLTAFKPQIDSVAFVLEYFSDLFGLYPFHEEKYGHCMAPFSGGMEHQTMTSIGNLGSFSTNSHELMHQWFGDHVTCKTWSDIFINEGFASYGEYLAYEHFRGLAAAQTKMLNVHNDVLTDATAMVYFTDTTNVNRIFDSRLTYNKGSAVIHTLRFILGDSLFFKGLKEFQQNFSFATAGINDLKLSMENSTGKNLTDYFSQWLYGEGFPTFSGEYASDGNNIFLKITHNTSSTATTLFKTPLEIKCSSAGGDTIVKVDITQNTNTFIIPSGKTITNISFDPNNWLLNEKGSVTENPALIPVAVHNIEIENAFSVYPNPGSGQFLLRCNKPGNVYYSLKEINGRNIMNGVFQNNIPLDVSSLCAGVYFIEFKTASGIFSKKITKL